MAQKALGKFRVFVYGTLKSGKQNHGLMITAGANFEGPDTITGPYQLAEIMGVPALMHHEPSAANKRTIEGEVWSGNAALQDTLDTLEGTGLLYKRVKVWSDLLKLRVWCYFILPTFWKECNEARLCHILPETNWEPTPTEIAFWNNHRAS